MKQIVNIPSGGWKLHGIVHVPARTPERRVGVVLVQGPNTKFGTHRLFPQVAEALVEAGFFVLRYDNRGTCDSPGICELTFVDRVADVHAVASFFRQQYRLDAVLGWGLCMGAAVGIHAAATNGERAKWDGLILVNILAHPPLAGVPRQAYSELDGKKVAKNVFSHQNPVKKIWKILTSRENWLYKGPALLRRYLHLDRELNDLRKDISRVGAMLTTFEGPMLLLFGERDRYWAAFRDEVNAGDRLGLAKKAIPPDCVAVKDGDHTFSSASLMAELLRRTTGWAQPFLRGVIPGSAGEGAASEPGPWNQGKRASEAIVS
jgi:pimeloyl-ACP methyl ester carboxylesterase